MMRGRRSPLWTWQLAGWLLLGASRGWAACTGYDASQWTAASEQQARACLTNFKDRGFSITQCELGVCKQVVAWRSKPAAQRVREAPRLLDDVRADLAASSDDARRLDAAMAAFIARLRAATPATLADPARDPFRNAASQAWAYDAPAGELSAGGDASSGPVTILLRDSLARACAEPVVPAQCSRAVADAGATLVHAMLYGTVVNGFVKEDRDAFLKFVTDTEKRWDNYFDKSRFQYPWELWTNSLRFSDELEKLRKTSQDAQGRGLVGPPSNQLIWLHPSAGLRYAGDADRKLDQMVVLEALGYYKWEWSGTEPKNLLGGSLIATWSGSGTALRKGYGFMVHLPSNYSIGLVQERLNGKTNLALTLSVDLGKLFQDPAAQKRWFLDKIK